MFLMSFILFLLNFLLLYSCCYHCCFKCCLCLLICSCFFDVVIAIVVDIVVPFYYYCFLKLNFTLSPSVVKSRSVGLSVRLISFTAMLLYEHLSYAYM